MTRVWAPSRTSVELVRNGTTVPMTQDASGWWTTPVELGHGDDYAFRLDGGPPRPDPRSPWQPAGVHAASRHVDHTAFSWTDSDWRGVPLHGAVLYELHVGTFTAEGTFEAALSRMSELVDLGVTAVELLPVNAFPGRWGWGYDGVGWFAVQDAYGGPEGLKRFVDGCHALGLGVVLDVVYNHLGPAGNYLAEFGPYLTDAHHTPWGPAVNLDQTGSDEVRRFVRDSVLAWLRDYHVDGLRLDAVHELRDGRAVTLLEELAADTDALGAELDKPLWLVAESDRNDPRTVTPRNRNGLGLAGQWADDVHHALHALLTGERAGYYADFGSLPTLAKALTGVFVHDGTWSSFRGRTHGRPVPADLSGHPFVVYLQDHDQVGNRAIGDRLTSTVSDRLVQAGLALVLTSACTPMLFMGEEWGARTPWMFFSDHDGDLGDAVRTGRRAEFASHGWSTEDVPDPQAESTFLGSKLDWDERTSPRGREFLDWTRSLLALRRDRLGDDDRAAVSVQLDEQARWLVVRRPGLAVAVNLAQDPQDLPVSGTVLLANDRALTPGTALAADRVTVGGEATVVLAV